MVVLMPLDSLVEHYVHRTLLLLSTSTPAFYLIVISHRLSSLCIAGLDDRNSTRISEKITPQPKSFLSKYTRMTKRKTAIDNALSLAPTQSSV
jgi:hypothetical protein